MPAFNSLKGSEHVKKLLQNTYYGYLGPGVGAHH